MRILHIEDYVNPQLGYQTVYLAKHHRLQGHEVTILSSDDATRFWRYEWADREFARVSDWEGVRIVRLAVTHRWFGRPWLRGVERAIEDIAPDVVVMHGTFVITALRVMIHHAFRRDYWLIVDDHMTYRSSSRTGARAFYGIVKLLLAPTLLRTVDALVAVSEETREFMCEKYGVPRDRIRVIPLGVDTTVFSPYADRIPCRRALGYGTDDIVIVYAGKITATKDPAVLVRAVGKIADTVPGIRLLLVGAGDDQYMEYMMSLVHSIPSLGNRVNIIHGVPNHRLVDIYNAGDIGCWPRASSLTMLEAMACGVPIIVSDQPAAAERVRYGGGIAYPEGDVDHLADLIHSLCCDSEVRSAFASRAREVATTHFDYSEIARRFLATITASDRADISC